MASVFGVILCLFGVFGLCVDGAVLETNPKDKFCSARYGMSVNKDSSNTSAQNVTLVQNECDVKALIQTYETETSSKFVIYYSDKSFGSYAFKFRVRSTVVHKECFMFTSESVTTISTTDKPTGISSSEIPSTQTVTNKGTPIYQKSSDKKKNMVDILEANVLHHTEGGKRFLAAQALTELLPKSTKDEATTTVTDEANVMSTIATKTQDELTTEMDTDGVPITLTSPVNTKQTKTESEVAVTTTTLQLSTGKQTDVFDKVTKPTQIPTLLVDTLSSELTTDTLGTSTTTTTTRLTTTPLDTNITDIMAKISTTNRPKVVEESISTQITTKIDENTTDNPSKTDVIGSSTPPSTAINADNGVAKKVECMFFVKYQEIQIVKKHIFKGKDELKKMKRVKDLNTRLYASTIRLDMNFNKILRGHYLYVGKAIPNGKDEDYVFMANDYNVISWKRGQKYKKTGLFTDYQNKC